METRSKRKKKIKEEEDRRNPNFRSWSDLPQDILLPIVENLSFSIPDLFSVAAVSRPFRDAALAASKAVGDSAPPLLLSPLLSRHHDRIRWRGPPQCRLQTLTQNPNCNPSSYKSIISSKILRKRCIGCSNGNLIFDFGRKALIVDVFTGRKIRSPKFPPSSNEFQIGILTGPPSSEGSTLLLIALSCTFCWRLDEKEWVIEYLRYKREISAFVIFNGKLYVLDDYYRIKVVDFNLPMTWKTLELGLPNPPNLRGNFGKYLVECGGIILLVIFNCLRELDFRIDVYRLDFENVKWEKVDGLGDWCLFVDVEGNCPMVCSNPSRWGGRSNSVYLAGPGDDTWAVFPLDGSVIDAIATKSALSSSYIMFPRWPSPMWVYPSKFLSRRVMSRPPDVDAV